MVPTRSAFVKMRSPIPLLLYELFAVELALRFLRLPHHARLSPFLRIAVCFDHIFTHERLAAETVRAFRVVVQHRDAVAQLLDVLDLVERRRWRPRAVVRLGVPRLAVGRAAPRSQVEHAGGALGGLQRDDPLFDPVLFAQFLEQGASVVEPRDVRLCSHDCHAGGVGLEFFRNGIVVHL